MRIGLSAKTRTPSRNESQRIRILETSIKLQSGQEHRKEVKEPSFIEGASIVYVAQGELEKHVEDPAHLESFINKVIFESNEIKDSQLLFDYESLNEEVSDLTQGIAASNGVVFSLENETDVKREEDLKREGKTLSTDLRDTSKKIEELAKGLSPEKVREAEEKQKHLTGLRDRKTQLTELGITIKEAMRFSDENLALFNIEI